MDNGLKKFVVITSIYSPTEAVKRYAQIPDINTVVVGDRKSPRSWTCENVVYLSVDDQSERFGQFAQNLPYNHYARKMTGYLSAIQQNADIIIDTDDDNIPKSDWIVPDMYDIYPQTHDNLGFLNIYACFTSEPVWPRGFPLHAGKSVPPKLLKKENGKIGICQGLADHSPDVDAVCRLLNAQPIKFNDHPMFCLGQGTISPVNSQNTIFRREFYPLLYLPATVSFRFTDILRGYVAQPILWSQRSYLGIIRATVRQERNEHNIYDDLVSEIPMYQFSDKIVEWVDKVVFSHHSLCDNLFNAYHILMANKVVDKNELSILEKWIDEIQKLRFS